jgi:malate dehydrogenase (oxaloacetate-decarboxylating)
LDNLEAILSAELDADEVAQAKTLFLKRLSEAGHRFYQGKMQTVPKAGVFGFNWFNVWYTPGVSAISTAIRDDNDASYDLINRGNTVAVVSDSTRVLGDGNVTPPGGLGVMEGKAFLMKYLGGIDATPLCIDSRNAAGAHDPDKIIDFVQMVQPSFGAINLEDISQPNCFKVLDTLRERCEIPVWHDDAQGTASVTLAGLLNALKLVDKAIGDVNIVLLGAGASNTTIARILLAAGADPARMVLFDSKGGLHTDRDDIQADPRFYRKWELCEATNPGKIHDFDAAMKGADVLIAASRPGPGIVKPALMVRARGISDEMTITAAQSLAAYAEARGIAPDNIMPRMDERSVFPQEAADVAMQAVAEGLARTPLTREAAFAKAEADIVAAREMTELLIREGLIATPPQAMLDDALAWAMEAVGE